MKSEINCKTYCILTPRVAGMGGAQLYALRRMNYLKSKRHHAIILVSDSKNFLLKDKFNSFEIIQVPELASPVFYYSRTNLNSILDHILDKLDTFRQSIVIESHTLTLAIWGELLAERSRAKHIIYPLNERPLTSWEFFPVKDFFLWKLGRVEFIGPSESSLRIVLGRYFTASKAYYSNIGFDPNELPASGHPDISDLSDKSFFRIGTISRLSKPYVSKLIKSVIRIAGKYPERKILLIIAGDDPDKSILEQLKRNFDQTGNLKIIFPGYLNPMGKDFFQNLDVFVGMATAAINSISLSCATITVDPIAIKSSGFFGLTSKDTMFADIDMLSTLDYWIEIALINPEILENARKAGYELFRKEYFADACLKKIEDLINSSDSSEVYWSFPKTYLSSRLLKCHYQAENSALYRGLQNIYGLRALSKWG